MTDALAEREFRINLSYDVPWCGSITVTAKTREEACEKAIEQWHENASGEYGDEGGETQIDAIDDNWQDIPLEFRPAGEQIAEAVINFIKVGVDDFAKSDERIAAYTKLYDLLGINGYKPAERLPDPSTL